jgi:hypothetical protein
MTNAVYVAIPFALAGYIMFRLFGKINRDVGDDGFIAK